jgi:hypothetical protein
MRFHRLTLPTVLLLSGLALPKAMPAQTPASGTNNAESEQEAPGTAGPTLEDTGQWIQTHLVGLHAEQTTTITSGPETSELTDTHSITKASMKGCTLSVDEKVSMKNGDWSWTSTYTVPLAEVRSVDWTHRDAPPSTMPNWSGAIYVSGTRAVIMVHTVDASKDIPPKDKAFSSFGIFTYDEAIAARMVKALQHAVALCKLVSKPDIF